MTNPPPRLVPLEPFPAYRYVPGRGPHPLKHKDGHSFGRDEGPPPPESSVAFVRGHHRAIDLFNHRYFWEAHEAWEHLWHGVSRESATGQLLQALIQMAARQLKVIQEMPEAERRLHTTVSERLARVMRLLDAEHHLGLDVLELDRQWTACSASGAAPALRLTKSDDATPDPVI